MLFFFKEKPVEITAYCRPGFNFANEFSPITPAKNLLPTWWKDTPSSSFSWEERIGKNTVKSCPGIINTLTTGLIIPLWSDLALQYNDIEYAYNFSDKISSLDMHSEEESPGYYKDYWHFKITSPWLLETSVKLLYTQPTYLQETPYPFISPYGIVSPVKDLTGTNIFLFIRKEEQNSRLMLKQGLPLLHIIPLTDKKIKFSIKQISNEDFLRKSNIIGIRNRFNLKGLRNALSKK